MTLAAADLNGDRKADVIVGTGPGVKAQVVVLNGASGATLETLAPFSPGFQGGVSVAAADVNGDHRPDVVVATGAGTASVVRVFSGATKSRLLSFGPYAPSFTGGVAVAAYGADVVDRPG